MPGRRCELGFGDESGCHILELLEGANLDSCAGGLCLEHLLFTSERIDALTCFNSWLIYGDDLQQTGQHELATALFGDVAFDDARKTVEDSGHIFTTEFGLFSNLIEDLGFGVALLDCGWFLSHVQGIRSTGAACQDGCLRKINYFWPCF